MTTAPFGVPVPVSENVTGSADVPVFSATTATVPSVFLKASRVRFPSDVVAPMRTAPGRTKSLKLPNAHSRPDGVTVEPLIWMRLSLSPFPEGVDG